MISKSQGRVDAKKVAKQKKTRMERRYVDTLVYKANRAEYLQKDLKEIFKPKFNDSSVNFRKEFARQCHSRIGALPTPSIVIQNLFRKDLYSLMNVGVSKEQSQALGKAFKYNHYDINEICLINNNIADQ